MHIMGPGELSETTIYASLINAKVYQKNILLPMKKHVYYHIVYIMFLKYSSIDKAMLDIKIGLCTPLSCPHVNCTRRTTSRPLSCLRSLEWMIWWGAKKKCSVLKGPSAQLWRMVLLGFMFVIRLTQNTNMK